MPTNDFLPFATAAGANVESQASYAVDPVQTGGYSTGIAPSAQVSKVNRQGNFFSAVLGGLIVDILAEDCLDDGDLQGKTELLWETWLRASYFLDTGTASALVTANPAGITFPAPAAGLRVTILAANACTGATTFAWMGTTAKAVTYNDLTALNPGDYTAGTLLDLEYDGTRWQLVSVPKSAIANFTRLITTTNVNLYINASTGNDSTGTGAIGEPWQTIQHGWNMLQQHYDLDNQFAATLNCTGAFTVGLNAHGPISGSIDAQSVVLLFTSGATIAITNGDAFSAQEGSLFTVQGTAPTPLVITASGTGPNQGHAYTVNSNSIVNVGANVNYGACASAVSIVDTGGIFVMLSDFSKSGNGQQLLDIGPNGYFSTNPITATQTGTPTYSDSTVNCQHGYAGTGNITWSGGCTSTNIYNVIQTGVIDNTGGGVFPGGGAAATSSGGQYVGP